MKVSIGAVKEIWDFTDHEYNVIFDELTLPNPAYEQVLKHSQYTTTKVPKYLFYAQGTSGLLGVPRGYKIPFTHQRVKDERFTLTGSNTINYPKLKIELRKTQQEAIDAYIEAREKAIESKENVDGVLVVPTGKGKSILGLAIAAKLKQRALIVVWKDDLVDGWMEDANVALGLKPKHVGLIKAQNFRLGERVTITTIQTLSKLPPEKMQMLREYFSMIIVDEFHHSASKIYEVLTTFPALDRIGLTATDMRNDKLDQVLNFYFGDVCYRFEETDDDEDIIAPKNVEIIIKYSNIKFNPPDIYNWSDGFHHGLVGDLFIEDEETEQTIRLVSQSDEWKEEILRMMYEGRVKRKPLNPHQMYDAIDQDIAFNLMVAKDVAFEYNDNKSCLIFCKEKEHVRLLSELIQKQGVPESQVQLYYGDMKGKDAKKIMKRRAESKEVLVTIATYSIATEGTNVKSWERVFLAMTFNNPVSAIQAIGRGRRKKDGKSILRVYDYRHEGIKGARNHGATRDKVYRTIGFTIIDQSKPKCQPNSIFTRGFGKR